MRGYLLGCEILLRDRQTEKNGTISDMTKMDYRSNRLREEGLVVVVVVRRSLPPSIGVTHCSKLTATLKWREEENDNRTDDDDGKMKKKRPLCQHWAHSRGWQSSLVSRHTLGRGDNNGPGGRDLDGNGEVERERERERLVEEEEMIWSPMKTRYYPCGGGGVRKLNKCNATCSNPLIDYIL